MGGARKVAGLANDRGEQQEGGGPGSTESAKNSPFCYDDGHLSQECGVRTVKNDSGSYAVFAEPSASQMTAAKVMDVIARLPECAGQAAEAVSAYTPVQMEDAPKLLKIPKSECPDIWMCPPRHKWPKFCSNIDDFVVLP